MDIPNLLSTVIYFLIVLSVLALVHEIGHFIFARRFGVRVEEFGLGLPPRAATLWRERGMIQIQSKKIRIPRKFVVPEAVQPGSWVVYKTALENGKDTLTAIDPVDAESRGMVAASQVQDLDRGTIYSLNWLPIGGFVRMTGEENPSDPRSFAAAAPWKRAVILCAGVSMNILLAIVLFTIIATVGMPKPIELVTVGGVSPGSPAASAGLKVGDRLISINGTTMQNRLEVSRAASETSGQEITLELKRGPENVIVNLTPRVHPPKNEGPIGISLTGQLIRSEIVSYPIWEAIPLGVGQTVETAGLIGNGFRRMFSQGVTSQDVGGPIQIAEITGQAAQAGLLTLMQLTALLSVNLAILNILPVPALDGGRLVFVLIEAVRRGKRISPQKEGMVHIVGMAILLILMVIISINDVGRIIGRFFPGG